MNKRLMLMVTLLTGLLVLTWGVAAQDQPKTPPHWEYEGEEGPDAWGDLDESFALCSTGRAQSPIDVTGAASLNLSDIAFSYLPATNPIINNGHTIQVNYPADGMDNTIVYNETTYDLFQFHFHHPSEHTIDGVPAAMEIHFVHRARNAAGEKDPNGAIAVVGVMLMEGDEENIFYTPIFNNLPAVK
ncbi:MAG TPA: carbonic anhydrase family protein, partial [Phototrophicaceae bacterium]|nr:carbonic anhydrase family protein [Phototrophicaceae bacterium]